jgi:hypothetical protein
MAPKRDDIVKFLEKHPTQAYCDECVRQALALFGVEVTMSTNNFAAKGDDRVVVASGWCSECRKRDRVVRSGVGPA